MLRFFRSRALFLSVAALAVIALVGTACGGSGGASTTGKFPAFQRGNQITVTVYDVSFKNAVYYQDTDQTIYVVKPADRSKTLAVVDAQVRNDRSTNLIMNVDERSYTLLDKDGNEYKSVNPFSQREIAPNKPQTEPFYYLIWKDFNIPLDYGIRGIAIFEVPKDVVATQFRWEAVDTVFVRFT
jgi:hypothetical protein